MREKSAMSQQVEAFLRNHVYFPGQIIGSCHNEVEQLPQASAQV